MTLELQALSVLRGRLPVLPPVTLNVPPGEVATIMGPSGIGKSTLLDAVGGHLQPEFSITGRVLLDGRDVTLLPPEERKIGLLFQDARLFPHLSVGDNLAFGLAAGRRDRRAAVAEALTEAGLEGFERRDPATLSGGERARVALMRSLLARPRAFLMDEPFSRLDAGLRAEIRAFAFDHLRAEGIPALLVTHDAEDAAAAGGQILRLGPTGLPEDLHA
jgi:putative thiamine transport system ATP-binding protein